MTKPVATLEMTNYLEHTKITRDLVWNVKQYANQKYDQGWSVVVEAYSDLEIIEVIQGAATVMGAKRKMAKHLKPRIEAEQQHDAEAAAGNPSIASCLSDSNQAELDEVYYDHWQGMEWQGFTSEK